MAAPAAPAAGGSLAVLIQEIIKKIGEIESTEARLPRPRAT